MRAKGVDSVRFGFLLVGFAFAISPELRAQPANQGWVSTYVFAHGGCKSHRDLFQGFILNRGASRDLLGRSAADWKEADAAEALRVYKDCDALFITQGQSGDSRQQLMARMYAANAATQAVALQNALSNFVNTGKVQQQQSRLEQEAWLAQSRADAQRKLDEESRKAQSQRDKLLEQSKVDQEAAEESARRANEEAPKIAQVTKEAEEARAARQAAEARLAEVRGQIAAENAKGATEMAKRQAVEAAQQAERRRQAEQEEDVKLSQKCQVNLERFNQARFGMQLREVERLFGCKGSQTSGTRIPGYGVVSTYSWEGTSFPSNVTATFRNSSLESKAQVGLD